MIYVKFDFKVEIRRGTLLRKDEISRGTSEPYDNLFESNTVMVGSMGLIASLPQSYLVYLDSLPMKKRNLTGWVKPPKKWNQM